MIHFSISRKSVNYNRVNNPSYVFIKCSYAFVCDLTDRDIRRTVRFQEAVEMMPNRRDPLNNFHQLPVPHTTADLCLQKLPAQETSQEAFHRLGMIGT